MPVEAAREDVQRLVATDGQVVDVLPPAEYANAHVQGAVNIPLKTMTAEAVSTLDAHRPVVVYCMDAQ